MFVTSVKYHANVPFTTHVGTTVQLLDFFATDNDGNNITYAINDGNLRCPEVWGCSTVKDSLKYTFTKLLFQLPFILKPHILLDVNLMK